MTLWSVEVGEHDCISRIHPLKMEEPAEPWKIGWVNALICFALIAFVVWGMR